MIEGSNVFLNHGNIERMGFFTTRWIEAKTGEDAEQMGLAHVRQELESLSALCNSPADPPILSVVEVREVESFGDKIVPGKGFSLFKDELPKT